MGIKEIIHPSIHEDIPGELHRPPSGYSEQPNQNEDVKYFNSRIPASVEPGTQPRPSLWELLRQLSERRANHPVKTAPDSDTAALRHLGVSQRE